MPRTDAKPTDDVARREWSDLREVRRLIERHRQLLVREFSQAGWKTARMVEARLHAICDRILRRWTEYPSLRWLIAHREVVPSFSVERDPGLRAVAEAFEYLERLSHPEDPRKAGME